jgi:F420-0:gamma-glutamyl ligase
VTEEPSAAPEEPGESSASPTPDDEASQEELRKLEEEIKKVSVEDVILQSTVSILNLAARRIAKEDERDLEQGKAGIDATRSLLEHLPEDARDRVREALTELQMLYAKEAGAEEAKTPPGEG